jgi:hypothetical protein
MKNTSYFKAFVLPNMRRTHPFVGQLARIEYSQETICNAKQAAAKFCLC